MTIANSSQESAGGLPHPLRTAQEAVHLPEVQEMLRKLSEYKLGIFMPHMHDEQTGEFQTLPDEVMQVESGLVVSFQPTEEITIQTDRFLPVGWFWRAGASTFVAFVCSGFLPLIPFTVPLGLAANHLFLASAVLTVVTFFLIGAAKGRVVHRSVFWSGLETLAVGAVAAGLAYAVGILFHGA